MVTLPKDILKGFDWCENTRIKTRITGRKTLDIEGMKVLVSCVVQYKIETMKMGRRKFLKSIAFAGAMAVMGFSGCLSSPELAPTPTPTPRPTIEPKPISRSKNKNFTETKKCPQCWMPTLLHLMDIQGVLWWVCDGCSYIAKVMEPEILRKYGYI